MKPEQQAAIDAAAATVADARVKHESIGMMNVNGGDEAYRMRLSMAYAQASSELANAQDALRRMLAKYEG